MPKRPVYGIGVNDADYQVVNSKAHPRLICPMYSAWLNMLDRVYRLSLVTPSYDGCSVSVEWLIFSNFHAWAISRYKPGYQLDKDILHPGNKTYSAETCLFVPAWVNNLVVNTNVNKDRPSLIGVQTPVRGRPTVCIRYRGKQIRCGRYGSVEEAGVAYLNLKAETLRMASESLQDEPEIARALLNHALHMTDRRNELCLKSKTKVSPLCGSEWFAKVRDMVLMTA